jgi:hypothetical protein
LTKHKKGFALKTIILGIISILMIWTLKNYVFLEWYDFNITLLDNYSYNLHIQGIIPSSIVTLFTRLSMQGILDAFFNDFKLKLPLGEELNPNKSNIKSFILTKDNGEGSSRGEGSSNNPESKGGRVIGPEDYTFDSDSERNYYSEEESRETGDNLSNFKAKVENMSNKEDVSDTKEKIEQGLNAYKSSGENVPAFKQQVTELEKKIEICDNKLSELDKNDKGKGKEVLQDTASGKRVANPQDNPEPASKRVANQPAGENRLVPNPNYQPAAGSRLAGWVEDGDYLYDSDAEERAVRRAMEESVNAEERALRQAIEESMKAEQNKTGESSKSNKGKDKEE